MECCIISCVCLLKFTIKFNHSHFINFVVVHQCVGVCVCVCVGGVEGVVGVYVGVNDVYWVGVC